MRFPRRILLCLATLLFSSAPCAPQIRSTQQFPVPAPAPQNVHPLATHTLNNPYSQTAHRSEYWMYVGTYTDKGPSKGIYEFRFDASTGQITANGLAAEAKNPSFVAVHPNQKYLYAVNEMGDFQAKNNGGVSAFSIDKATGKLKFLNEVKSGGADPCFITIDSTGRFALVANYTGGSVAVFPIKENGKLGEASSIVQHSGTGADPKRQEEAHVHSVNMSPDNRYAIVADLGLDTLTSYRFDSAKGVLSEKDPQVFHLDPGSGPRHFTFHPNGRFGYVISEMKATVTALSYNPKTGAFSKLQTISTLPAGFSGRNDDAEVRVHPSGKFLYASNRGHDTIAVFSIDRKTGKLTPVQDAPTGGKEPRNFMIDPSGKRLLAENQNSASIEVFNIDPKTGTLTDTGKHLEVDSPVCIRFAELPPQ